MKKILVSAALCAVFGAGAVDLRGYGEVNARFEKGETVFECESAQKADWLYAKLIRDVEEMDAARRMVRNGAVDLGGGRTAVIGRRGNAVVVRDGSNAQGLSFPEPKFYPVFLDNYDLRSHKYYGHPMSSFKGYGLESHWPFAKKHNITGFVFHGISLESQEAPGIIDFSAMDYEMEAARKAGGAVSVSCGIGAAWPLWMYNEAPETTAKIQSSSVVEEWTSGTPFATFEGYGKGFDPKKSPVRAFQKQVMDRYKDHPNVACWQLYRGAPIGDQFGPAFGGYLWDASDAAKAAFREWAKGRWTLAQLGERWHGDAAHFASWDEVVYPQLMDILGGNYDKDRFVLNDLEWEWVRSAKDDYGKYPTNGFAWVAFKFPPSKRMQFFEAGSAYFRVKNIPGTWISKNAGKEVHLKFVCRAYDEKHMNAWVNGKFLASEPFFSSGARMNEVVIPAGTLKGDGTDEIVFQTPIRDRGAGRIHGPVSLSLMPAQNYPFADKHVNAQYVDVRAFEYDALRRRNEETFRYARHIDPDRPMSLSGAEWGLFTELMPFFSEQGVSIQTTSIDAFYWPQIADWGMLYGFYGIAEPSGNLREANYANIYGQQLYCGMSASAMFMEIEMYMDLEKKTGLVSKWASLLRLFGHYLIEQPKFAQMCSVETHTYSGTSPQYDWNLLRGELQYTHHDGLLVTDAELKNGMVNAKNFPVIMDMSDVMTDETVAAIRSYVEAGGTFIATPHSGRHSILERNAYPLAPLAGVKIRDDARSGKISFAKDETLFPLWVGKELDGDGNAKDWKMRNCSEGRKMDVIANDVEVIAKWSDGTPAIAMRKIGKGRLVTFATGFYRDARDVGKKWAPTKENKVLGELMDQLGLERKVRATDYKVWVRKAVSKTGLEDFVIATNMAETEPYDVKTDIEVRLDYKPESVIDAASGMAVPFDYENGVCKIRAIEFGRYDSKIFAMSRPHGLSEALKVWWGEKEKYWKRGPAITECDPEPTHVMALNLTDWEMREAGREEWRKIGVGSWKILIPELKDYAGEATYRTKFMLPAGWKGCNVTLNFDTKHSIHDKAEFFVNGTKVAFVDRTKLDREIYGSDSHEISKFLNFEKENEIEIRMTGGSTLIAGIAGNVYLEKEREFVEEKMLDGKWEVVGANYVDCKEVELPGMFNARYLRKTFDIPKEWAGKKVFVRIVSDKQTISAVSVNDYGKSKLQNLECFGNRQDVNVTEFVKPGEKNVIELWGRRTLPTPYYGDLWRWPKTDKLSVSSVVIGVVKDDK